MVPGIQRCGERTADLAGDVGGRHGAARTSRQTYHDLLPLAVLRGVPTAAAAFMYVEILS